MPIRKWSKKKLSRYVIRRLGQPQRCRRHDPVSRLRCRQLDYRTDLCGERRLRDHALAGQGVHARSNVHHTADPAPRHFSSDFVRRTDASRRCPLRGGGRQCWRHGVYHRVVLARSGQVSRRVAAVPRIDRWQAVRRLSFGFAPQRGERAIAAALSTRCSTRACASSRLRAIRPTSSSPRLKAAGCIIIHKAPSVRFALSAERLGVDAVTLVGIDGGGHPGMDISEFVCDGAARRAAAEDSVRRSRAGSAPAGNCWPRWRSARTASCSARACWRPSEIWAHPDYKRQLLAAWRARHPADPRQASRTTIAFLPTKPPRRSRQWRRSAIAEIEPICRCMAGALTRRAYESGDLRKKG